MSLDNYVWQARAIADELLELLTAKERKEYRAKLDADDPDCWDMSTEALRRALRFATETPAKRREIWKRTPAEGRMPLWCLARAQALRSANILSVARDAEDVPGMGYRKAVAHVALAVRQQHLLPAQDELMDPALEQDG